MCTQTTSRPTIQIFLTLTRMWDLRMNFNGIHGIVLSCQSFGRPNLVVAMHARIYQRWKCVPHLLKSLGPLGVGGRWIVGSCDIWSIQIACYLKCYMNFVVRNAKPRCTASRTSNQMFNGKCRQILCIIVHTTYCPHTMTTPLAYS